MVTSAEGEYWGVGVERKAQFIGYKIGSRIYCSTGGI